MKLRIVEVIIGMVAIVGVGLVFKQTALAKELAYSPSQSALVQMHSEPVAQAGMTKSLVSKQASPLIQQIENLHKVKLKTKQDHVRKNLTFMDSLEGRVAYAIGNHTNLYGAPELSAYVLGKMNTNKPITIKKELSEWYVVEYEGQNGFAKKDQVIFADDQAETEEIILRLNMESELIHQMQNEAIRHNFLSQQIEEETVELPSMETLIALQEPEKVDTTNAQTRKALFESTDEMSDAQKTMGKDDFFGRVQNVDWWNGGNKVLERSGGEAIIYDVETGKSFNVRRTGGTNHSDGTPMTAEDTAIMLSIYGGKWSHERRSILLIVKDNVYAASLYGMPHGKDVQPNDDFPGVLCIHLLNSKTHGGNHVDSDHQAMIDYAFKTFAKEVVDVK